MKWVTSSVLTGDVLAVRACGLYAIGANASKVDHV
jgi:hypothetical protein